MAGLPFTNIPTGSNAVTSGTSPLFPIRPLATVPPKIANPPVPEGWEYLCGPVTKVADCRGVPAGVREITRPTNVARIAYGTYGFRTVYWQAPDGSIYASLDGKVPQTYYEGDVKRTTYTHVIWGYRWAGKKATIGTGGGLPINPLTVSGGGSEQEQTPDSPPMNIPPIFVPGTGGTGGTPTDPITPDQTVVPQDDYPGGGWGYHDYALEPTPEPEVKATSWWKYLILAGLGGAATYAVMRNSDNRAALAAGGAAASAGVVYLLGPGGPLRPGA